MHWGRHAWGGTTGLWAPAGAFAAQATDNVDNVESGSTTFTVTVKPTDLATLTTQFVRSSVKYQSSNALTRLLVSAAITVTTNALLDLIPVGEFVRIENTATRAERLHGRSGAGMDVDRRSGSDRGRVLRRRCTP